jgi:hypothetical protein
MEDTEKYEFKRGDVFPQAKTIIEKLMFKLRFKGF